MRKVLWVVAVVGGGVLIYDAAMRLAEWLTRMFENI